MTAFEVDVDAILSLSCNAASDPFDLMVVWDPGQFGVPPGIDTGPLIVNYAESVAGFGGDGTRRELHVRDDAGTLLLGYSQSDLPSLDPLELTIDASPCHPTEGTCSTLELTGELTAKFGEEQLELRPFAVGQLSSWTVRTGPLEMPHPDADYGCDGESGLHTFIAVAHL